MPREAWVTPGGRIGTWGCWDGRKEVAEWLCVSGQTSGGGPSGVELVGQRLIEHEVRDWFGLGGIEGRGLVEEVTLGWAAGRGR